MEPAASPTTAAQANPYLRGFPLPFVRTFMSSKQADVVDELQSITYTNGAALAPQLLQVTAKLRLPSCWRPSIQASVAACAGLIMLAESGEAPDQTILLLGPLTAMNEFSQVLPRLEARLTPLAEELRFQLSWLHPKPYHSFSAPGRTLDFASRTGIMGILNVTPDSFSDGGLYAELPAAVDRAHQMVAEGADIIDIGGQSSRPGSDPVSASEEARRVLPVVEALANSTTAILSVDTYRAEIARQALAAGAHLINDISALRFDPALLEVVATGQAALILMHMQGMPRTMHLNPSYEALIDEVFAFLHERLRTAQAGGIPAHRLLIDPGIGFGKTAQHNLELLNKLEHFQTLGRPLVIGTSRKSFIGHILGADVHERLEGTAATVATAIGHGADVIRVHDVKAMVRVARLMDALVRPRAAKPTTAA
jgi:dihydropteroate synthase